MADYILYHHDTKKPKHPADEAAQRSVEQHVAIDGPVLLAFIPDVKHTHHEDDDGRHADDGCPHFKED